MKQNNKIYVAGHRGLVGSAIVRRLTQASYGSVATRSHAEMDLEDQSAVFEFFESERPEYVFLAAARVGGILANNTYPADFIRSNLAIQCNVIEAAHRFGATKLMFLGSSCIYPKLAEQPISEESLLSGYLEPTNQPYAIAKIAGIEMCQSYHRQFGSNFISVMPTNLYGPNDNFDPQNSHVLPALLRKFHEAKVANAPEVVVWGSGTPRREFLHVDDLADACVHLMETHDDPMEILNIGCGEDISIADLAHLVASVVGYHGTLVFDRSKPDGTPRKLLNVDRLARRGWKARIPLEQGVAETYTAFTAALAPSASDLHVPEFSRA